MVKIGLGLVLLCAIYDTITISIHLQIDVGKVCYVTTRVFNAALSIAVVVISKAR